MDKAHKIKNYPFSAQIRHSENCFRVVHIFSAKAFDFFSREASYNGAR